MQWLLQVRGTAGARQGGGRGGGGGGKAQECGTTQPCSAPPLHTACTRCASQLSTITTQHAHRTVQQGQAEPAFASLPPCNASDARSPLDERFLPLPLSPPRVVPLLAAAGRCEPASHRLAAVSAPAAGPVRVQAQARALGRVRRRAAAPSWAAPTPTPPLEQHSGVAWRAVRRVCRQAGVPSGGGARCGQLPADQALHHVQAVAVGRQLVAGARRVLRHQEARGRQPAHRQLHRPTPPAARPACCACAILAALLKGQLLPAVQPGRQVLGLKRRKAVRLKRLRVAVVCYPSERMMAMAMVMVRTVYGAGPGHGPKHAGGQALGLVGLDASCVSRADYNMERAWNNNSCAACPQRHTSCQRTRTSNTSSRLPSTAANTASRVTVGRGAPATPCAAAASATSVSRQVVGWRLETLRPMPVTTLNLPGSPREGAAGLPGRGQVGGPQAGQKHNTPRARTAWREQADVGEGACTSSRAMMTMAG